MNIYGEVPTMPAIAAQWMLYDLHNYTFNLHPELWSIPEINDYFIDKVWTQTRFIEDNIEVIPPEPGIYMFVAQPRLAHLVDHSYIFYIGKATSLKRRYRDYIKEKHCKLKHNRKEVVKFLNHLERSLMFHYVTLPLAEIAKAEAYLKDNIDPPANIQTEVIGRLET
jgi:hypothetical protein